MVGKNVWRGGNRSHQSFRQDYYRQAKDEPNTKGIVHPHYRAKPNGGTTTVKAHRRHR